MTVVTTAPTYLFWRCAPPELRVPQATAARRSTASAARPSRSARTARRRRAPTLRKLGVDVVVMGECEEVRGRGSPAARWDGHRRAWPTARRTARSRSTAGRRRPTSPTCAPLRWPDEWVAAAPPPPSPLRRAAARARAPRSRPRAAAPITAPSAPRRTSATATAGATLAVVLAEIDGLQRAGRRIRLLHRRDLPAATARCSRRWRAAGSNSACRPASTCGSPRCSTCSARAGCVSIEAGVESLTREGRDALAKNCKLDDRGAGRAPVLRQAPRPVRAGEPARDAEDDAGAGGRLARRGCSAAGVWANDPVPLFPYPGSPDYRAALGRAGRRGLGARARPLPRHLRATSATSRRPRPLPLRSWSDACLTR